MDESPRPREEPACNINRARDHMANERTYLAWMRTSVALIAFGIVIVRLRYLTPMAQRHGMGWELGLAFAAVGLLMVLLATSHYFQVQQALEAGRYEPEKRWIIACSLVVVLLGAGVLYYLLTSAPPGATLPHGTYSIEAIQLPVLDLFQSTSPQQNL